MNVAILGSSFDPPHMGHVKIAEKLLSSKKADKIIFMPVNIHPFAKKLSPSKHRLNMAKLLENKNIEASDLEINKNSPSYSIDTLRRLQIELPNDKLFWIIGSDNLKDFEKWKDWRKIISDFGLIVIPRDLKNPTTQKIKKISNPNIIYISPRDFPPINISSSEIRNKIKLGKSIKDLVPKIVEKYIIANKLYR